MRKLAEAIGYSVATLYLYFKDKDELLFTIVDNGFIEFSKGLAEASQSTDEPWERIVRMGQVYIEFGLKNPDFYQLMFMRRVDFLMQTREGEEHPRMHAFHILFDAVQAALDAGVMRPGDGETHADTLWCTMHGIVSMAILIPIYDEKRTQKLIQNVQFMIQETFYLKG